MGHLGKTTGFPSALLVTGLYFNLARADLDDDIRDFAMLAGAGAVTAASALMFSGFVTALALSCFGTCYLFLQLASDRKEGWQVMKIYARPAAVLAALVILAVLAYGVVSRPLYIGHAVIDTPWQELLYKATAVGGIIPGIADLPSELLTPTALLLAVLSFAVGALSLRTRQPAAGALVAGVAIFVVLLYVQDDRWRFAQTIPLYPTAVLCAAASLGGRLSVRGRSLPVFPLGAAVLVLFLAIGTYRANLVSDRLGGGPGTFEPYMFAQSEMRGLAQAVKTNGQVVVDVGPAPQMNLMVLLELGASGAPWQFSEASWKAALGYRIWKYPGELPGYNLRLVPRAEANSAKAHLLYRTRQFDLLGPEPAAAQ